MSACGLRLGPVAWVVVVGLAAAALAAVPAAAQADPVVECRAGEVCSPAEISVEPGDEFIVQITSGRGWAPVEWGRSRAVISEKYDPNDDVPGLTGSGEGGWACVGLSGDNPSGNCPPRPKIRFRAEAAGTAVISIWGIDALTVTVASGEPDEPSVDNSRPLVWISANPTTVSEGGGFSVRIGSSGDRSMNVHFAADRSDCLDGDDVTTKYWLDTGFAAPNLYGNGPEVPFHLKASVDDLEAPDCKVVFALEPRDRYQIDPARSSVTITILDDDPSFTIRHGDQAVDRIDLGPGEYYDYTVRVNSKPTKDSPDHTLLVDATGDITLSCGGGQCFTTAAPPHKQVKLKFNLESTQWHLCRSNIPDSDGNLPDPVWRPGCDGRQVYVGNGAWEKREWFVEWETRYSYTPAHVRVTRTAGSPSGSATVSHSHADAPDIPVTLSGNTPVVTVTAKNAVVTEGADARFLLAVSERQDPGLTVNIQITGQGTTHDPAGRHFSAPSTQIWASLSASVPTVDDDVDEPDGSITYTVLPGNGYLVGSPSTATATVRDNDDPPPPVTTAPPEPTTISELIRTEEYRGHLDIVRTLAGQTRHGRAHTDRWNSLLAAYGEPAVGSYTGGSINREDACANRRRFSSSAWHDACAILSTPMPG